MKEYIKNNKFQFIFLLVSLILYGNTLKNGYGLDDEFVTGPKNISSKGFKAIPKVFKVFHVTDESGNNYEYRPIVKATYAIESGLWGENLFLSHLVNILLYTLCLILLFKFLLLLFKETQPFLLFCVVILFAFIPVHSEVVASLKNRDVLLSFIFSISSFIFLINYIEKSKWYYLLLTILMFGIALLSKFDVIPLLLIMPLVLYQKFKMNLKWVIGFVVVIIGSFFLYKLTKGTMLDRSVIQSTRIYQYFENPLYFEHAFMNSVTAGLNSMGFYVRMLILPTKMACYYGYNVLPLFSMTSVYALIGLAVSGWLAYEFFNRFKNPDLLWYGILFFAGFISMYLNVVVPAAGVVADRFMFFASVGFCLIAGYYFFIFKHKQVRYQRFGDFKLYQKTISVIVLLFFAVIIIKRNTEWKDKLTLFESDVKKHPESVKLSLLTSSQVITNLNDGSNLIPENKKLEKVRKAERLLANAIKVDSSCAGCLNNLAYFYLSFERDPASALPYLRLGYKRDSTKKELACNIGIALFRLNKIADAKPYLLKAIELDNNHEFTVPYEVLQDLYMRTNPNEGLQFLAKELKKGYQLELLNVLIGKTYFEAKDTLNSLNYYKAAIAINPNNKAVNDFVTNLEVKYYKNRFK